MRCCVYRCCVYRKVCSACVALRTYSFNGLFRAPVFAVFECGAKVTISGGRTGELNFAIFQGALSTGGPRRATIEHEISPPPPRRFVVPLQSLEKKANIEHGVSICGIGIKRALQALDRLVDAALVIEDIGEVVPPMRNSDRP